MKVDRQLKESLARVPAPPGFTERAVARVKLSPRSWWSSRALMRIAAMLVLVAAMGSLGYVYIDEQKTRHRSEQAGEDLLLALRITAEKTELARRAMEN